MAWSASARLNGSAETTLEAVSVLLACLGGLFLLFLVSLAVTGGRLFLSYSMGVWMREPVDREILHRAYLKLGLAALVCLALAGIAWVIGRAVNP